MKILNLKVGHLFAGIGGFELAAELAGLENVFSCEIDKNKRLFLDFHFSNSIKYDDVRNVPKTVPSIDVLTGGFPCQDISTAKGKDRKGIEGDKSGLVYDMFRWIDATKPKYCIMENSQHLKSKGLDRILCEFAERGFYVEWRTLSNKSFGFSHQRKRLYIIAIDTEQIRLQEPRFIFRSNIENYKKKKSIRLVSKITNPTVYEKGLSESTVFESADGLSCGLSHLRKQVAGIGDAVNVFVAKYLFESIIEYHKSQPGPNGRY